MNTPNTAKEKREAYLERIRTALSSMPSMTSEEFYQQMERSMGMKTGWITCGTSSAASQEKPQERAISTKSNSN